VVKVHVISVDQLNAYDVLVNDEVVFTSAALQAFVARGSASMRPEPVEGHDDALRQAQGAPEQAQGAPEQAPDASAEGPDASEEAQGGASEGDPGATEEDEK
jgi:large subunit ribosomal protein L4